ncbi:MAG TPA: glutaredoxin family protein [Steroidobacteraceae bacterium]
MTLAARGARWRVYTREDCTLCDEFIAGLARALDGTGAAFEVVDVDADPATRRRFGLKVPVLTRDGRVVCHGHLDRAALARLL